MNIPMVDLKGQYESLKPESDSAILQALAETRFILGPNVQAFDAEATVAVGRDRPEFLARAKVT